MKAWAVVWVAIAGIFLSGVPAWSDSPIDECVKCHTDVKGLIRLGWEVEKIKPHKKSAETSGDG